jgi:tight adherence protein C
MQIVWVLAGFAILAVVLWWLWLRLERQRQIRQRMFAPTDAGQVALPGSGEEVGWLSWWLFRAGHRSPDAASVFVTATVALVGLGALFAFVFYRMGWLPRLVNGLQDLPSGLGDIFLPFAYALPWIVLVLLGIVPLLLVRRARRNRIAKVEEDLPITLELLATLADAGIGFDAALDRILQSQGADRPLVEELRIFQVELQAGRPRTECLRRLGRRLDVSSLTVLISALIQSEQVGSGVSDVLRRQVEDLRNRRRERALSQAATLPVKLLFPLVLCFLPGIFLAVLGPTFYQVFQMFDALNRNRGHP